MSAVTAEGASEGGRIAYLDGFRALAALAVVLYHGTSPGLGRHLGGGSPLDSAAWVDQFGRYGVCVFFLLSGLVLYRPFVASALDLTPRPNVAAYLARRTLRIYPAYVLALTFWYALGILGMAGQIAPQTYIAEYLLFQNYVPDGYEAALPVAWSLCVEIGFYLALPLLAAGIRRLPGARSRHAPDRLLAQAVGIAVLVMMAVGFRWYLLTEVPTWSGEPYVWLPNYLDWFALGMLLAIARTWCAAGRPLPRPAAWLVAHRMIAWVPALALYVWLVQVPSVSMSSFLLAGTSAFFLLLPAALPGRRRALEVLERRTFVYLGGISYGIYLWHKMVVDWTVDREMSLPTWQLLALVLVVTIPVAAASYHFLERPVQQLGRPRERRRAAALHLNASAATT